MNVQDLIGVIGAAVPFAYYPNRFPAKGVDDCASVKFTGGAAPDKYTIGVRSPSFQILVRAKHPSTAEAKANELFDLLNGKTHFFVGNELVASCFADQSAPVYIGDDENGRAVYSLNFTCKTKVQSNL